MELFALKKDVKVFGTEVRTFPNGIDEAFDSLVKMLPGGFNRSFYGISRMTSTSVAYLAAAAEKFPGEADQYKLVPAIIESGEYLAITIKDWRQKTATINKVFHEMLEDPSANRSSPCVEWYKNEKEMMCMVQTKIDQANNK